MLDFNKIMSGLAQSGVASGLAGGLAGGALTGALTSKGGRKAAKSLLKIGGIAAVGGLAWKAYHTYQQRNGAAPQANANTNAQAQSHAPASVHGQHMGAAGQPWQQLPQERFDVAQQDQQASGANSMLLIRAMITAALADGHMDAAEHQRILEQADQLDLGAAEKAALFDELRSPKSVESIVVEARDPALRVEVYAASVLAIDETRDEGRAYLERLATLLELPHDLVTAVHKQAESVPQTGVAA